MASNGRPAWSEDVDWHLIVEGLARFRVIEIVDEDDSTTIRVDGEHGFVVGSDLRLIRGIREFSATVRAVSPLQPDQTLLECSLRRPLARP